MSEFEDLRMIELVKKFKVDVLQIEETRSAALFKQASKDLQSVYNFHLTADKPFKSVDAYLKNIYKSFKCSAVIVNSALKKKAVKSEDATLLDECIQIMIKCCDVIIAKLSKKK